MTTLQELLNLDWPSHEELCVDAPSLLDQPVKAWVPDIYIDGSSEVKVMFAPPRGCQRSTACYLAIPIASPEGERLTLLVTMAEALRKYGRLSAAELDDWYESRLAEIPGLYERWLTLNFGGDNA